MVELADTIDLGSIARAWGFKSLYPHHLQNKGMTQSCNTFVFTFNFHFTNNIYGLKRCEITFLLYA